jgi:hypothetical protein
MRTAFATLVVSYVFLPFARPVWGGEQATLMVTTECQRSTYQIGERIPIDLSFTGPGNKQFEITMSSYDRSGRMAYEQFDVEPNSGWSDPSDAFRAINAPPQTLNVHKFPSIEVPHPCSQTQMVSVSELKRKEH